MLPRYLDRRTRALTVDIEARVGRRSKYASVALAVVMLALSVFALWSSTSASIGASRAVEANRLSNDYADAASAVSGQESLERKYRLEPGSDVRRRYDATAADFVAAMRRVRWHGGPDDRALVDDVLTQHRSYLRSTDRLFAAVDNGDMPRALRIDGEETEPVFSRIETAVLGAAQSERRESLARLSSLQRLEVLTARLTPSVFLVGLLLVATLASVTRGHRRLLGVERAQAVHDSLHDSLTGLPNRKLLAERFVRALQLDEGSGSSTALLLIDLDRFKDINDTFGHHYGDELLSQVGPRLTAALRDVDTVARLGGDEYAVLMPDIASVDDAVRVARKLRLAIETPFRVLGVDLDVEASVGVVLSGEHGLDASLLMQRADISMYVAKTQSLGVSVYDPDLDEHTPARLALLGDLRRALEHDELVLHYQPKISLSSDDVVGVEALVRWQHPERGLVLPDDFIPMAEHTGLMGALTRQVLHVALGQARAWSDAGHPLTVSVNLSARNLLDERLPEMIAELLAAHGVPPELLELEVTESAMMTEPVRAQQLLEQVSALGIRISIDDFGAGYTSLGQLRTLPVNELKIDKSFVMTMTEDCSNALIVRSVIDLGHNLGLSIVAEGVEKEQTLTALRDYGCDIAQGYHLGRPVGPATLEAWLSERRAKTVPAPPSTAGGRTMLTPA